MIYDAVFYPQNRSGLPVFGGVVLLHVCFGVHAELSISCGEAGNGSSDTINGALGDAGRRTKPDPVIEPQPVVEPEPLPLPPPEVKSRR